VSKPAWYARVPEGKKIATVGPFPNLYLARKWVRAFGSNVHLLAWYAKRDHLWYSIEMGSKEGYSSKEPMYRDASTTVSWSSPDPRYAGNE
jgi:hypothetical protein